MNKEINSKIAIIILVIFTAILIVWMIYEYQLLSFPLPQEEAKKPGVLKPEPKKEGLVKFSSAEEFKNYLAEAKSLSEETIGGLSRGRGLDIGALPEPMLSKEFSAEAGAGTPERFSETNVQVASVDEPDIVKTNGQEIYFSSKTPFYHYLPFEKRLIEKGKTKIIKAFPLENLALLKEIEESGDLLLSKNILIIFSQERIYGFNVSSPEEPKEIWSIDLEQNTEMVGARLFQDKIYLILRSGLNLDLPCPIKLFSARGSSFEIKCTDIYHPTVVLTTEVAYTALTLNLLTGEAEKTVSFTGSYNSSLIYMSKNNLYLAYSYTENSLKFFLNFLEEKALDLVPSSVINKLKKLDSYDISLSAKMTEFWVIFENYYSSLNNDERLKFENELNNRLTDYFKAHKRDLEKTALVKIDLAGFEIKALGNVPGQPLNQFSLDEYEGNLRIATTVGERRWIGFWGGTSESANDIYVLDQDLKIIGSLQDLGLEERIYSARFIEDKGYLVTFRQIDPFFVLDLSLPEKPELKGELKIPGYSSYLHPLAKDKILGIGKEENQVKISLFDVSNPANPQEKAKYTLNEYWSDILNTHHAFLLDSKHLIFFLPGSKGGYIFSYQNDKLELKKAVSEISARRALYINDYLYIVADDKLIVLNEINWEKVKELKIEN